VCTTNFCSSEDHSFGSMFTRGLDEGVRVTDHVERCSGAASVAMTDAQAQLQADCALAGGLLRAQDHQHYMSIRSFLLPAVAAACKGTGTLKSNECVALPCRWTAYLQPLVVSSRHSTLPPPSGGGSSGISPGWKPWRACRWALLTSAYRRAVSSPGLCMGPPDLPCGGLQEARPSSGVERDC